MALSNKQRVFIAEYIKCWNASEAARRAGYTGDANTVGPRLLANVGIKDAIRARTAEISMSADEVLTRLADIARGDMADLMALTTSGFTFDLMIKDAEGNLVPNPKTKLIKKIKQRVTTYLAKQKDGEDREIIETEIELYSALDALRDMGKFHKLFVERQEHTGKDGGAIEVKDVRDNILRKLAGSTATGDADEVSE